MSRCAPTPPPCAQEVRGITCIVTLFDCIQDGVLPAEMAAAIRATVDTAGGACVPLTAAARSMLLDAAAGPGWCTIVPVRSTGSSSSSSSALLSDAGRVSPLLTAKPVLIHTSALVEDELQLPSSSTAWQPLPLGWASSSAAVSGGGSWAIATILCARGEGSELVDLRVDATLTRARTSSLPPPLLTSLHVGYTATSTGSMTSTTDGLYTPVYSTVPMPRHAARTNAGTLPPYSGGLEAPMIMTTGLQPLAPALHSAGMPSSAAGAAARSMTSTLILSSDTTPTSLRVSPKRVTPPPAADTPLAMAADLVAALHGALGELHGADGAAAVAYMDMAYIATQVTPILRTMSEVTFEEKHALAHAEEMRAALASRGAVPLLITCIRAMGARSAEGRQALEFAVQALTNVAFNRSAQAVIAQDAIAVPVLLERMRVDGGDAEVALKVARCLATLCYDNPSAQARIISLGAVSDCARALHMHANIGFAVEKLLQLLTAVSEHPTAARAFLEAQVVRVLATVARAPACSTRIRGMLAKLRSSSACISSAASLQAAAAVSGPVDPEAAPLTARPRRPGGTRNSIVYDDVRMPRFTKEATSTVQEMTSTARGEGERLTATDTVV